MLISDIESSRRSLQDRPQIKARASRIFEPRAPAWLVASILAAAHLFWAACGGGSTSTQYAPPVVTLQTPQSPQSGVVSLTYLLEDSESDAVEIEVAYSVDGQPFLPATPAVGGDGVSGLASSPDGVQHVFMWSSLADITGASEVTLRVIALDNDGTSDPALTETFLVDNSSAPDPPSLEVDTPPSPTAGAIPVHYVVSHPQSEAVDLSVWVSVAGGEFVQATQAAGGDQTTGLATSPSGTGHIFSWDSVAQVPGASNDVILRLMVQTSAGATDIGDTQPFAVNNAVENDPPIATVQTPSGPQQGEVPLAYSLADPQDDLADVTVEFSRDGVAWAPATPAAGSEPTTGLVADPSGTFHSFTWDSLVDLPVNTQSVWLRLTPWDGLATGAPAQTATFEVRNAGFAPFGLQISEVHVGDMDALELRNASADPRSLDSLVLEWTDTAGESGAFTLPAVTIPAGEVIVLREGTGSSTPTTVYLGSNITWSETTGGSAALLSPEGFGLDFVRWGGTSQAPPQWTDWIEGTALPTPVGYAVLGRQQAEDTNHAGDFCPMPPSLGETNEPCLTSGLGAGILVSEVDIDDPLDSVEIVNTGAAPVNLVNWSISWAGENGDAGVALIPPYLLGPGQRVLILDNNSSGTPAPGTLVLADNLGWMLAEGGALGLLDPEGNGIDFLRWGQMSTPPPAPTGWSESIPLVAPGVSGITLSRNLSDTDTDQADDFCLQHASPGAPGGACLPSYGPASGVVVNEVDAGPNDAVEILNTSSQPVDLAMWVIAWTDTAEPPGQAMLPSILLQPGERLLLLENTGSPGPGEAFLGVNIPWFGGTTGGSVSLLDAYGRGVDFIRWAGSTQPPPAGLAWSEPSQLPSPPEGSVLGRYPDGTDTDAASDLCIQTPSPGLSNNACL